MVRKTPLSLEAESERLVIQTPLWQPQGPQRSGVEAPGPKLFWKFHVQGNGVQQRGSVLLGSGVPRDV